MNSKIPKIIAVILLLASVLIILWLVMASGNKKIANQPGQPPSPETAINSNGNNQGDKGEVIRVAGSVTQVDIGFIEIDVDGQLAKFTISPEGNTHIFQETENNGATMLEEMPLFDITKGTIVEVEFNSQTKEAIMVLVD